jgi:hypothetical protein
MNGLKIYGLVKRGCRGLSDFIPLSLSLVTTINLFLLPLLKIGNSPEGFERLGRSGMAEAMMTKLRFLK